MSPGVSAAGMWGVPFPRGGAGGALAYLSWDACAPGADVLPQKQVVERQCNHVGRAV